MATNIAQLENVSKRFVIHQQRSLKEKLVNAGRGKEFRQDFWALKDINLDIEFGTTVGLVGHNGSGKSTLLKVIGGIIAPTSGSVARRGRMAALLELGAGFHHDLTGRENVYLNASILGLTKKEIDSVFEAIVDFSGIEQFIDTQVKFYSSGMFVRLAFAVAVHVNPDLLLVDEVLAVGDEPFQQKCIDKIMEFQREGRTIVVVSHSAAQVKQLCDRAIVLEHGKMIFDGNTEEGIRILQQGYAAELAGSVVAPSTLIEKPHRGNSCITRAEVRQKGKLPNEKFVSGNDLEILVNFHNATDQGPLVGSIMLESMTRECFYVLDTRMIRQAVPGKPGDFQLKYSFPTANIGTGEYAVRAQLWKADGALIDELEPTPKFTMIDTKPGTGALSLDVNVDLLELN